MPKPKPTKRKQEEEQQRKRPPPHRPRVIVIVPGTMGSVLAQTRLGVGGVPTPVNFWPPIGAVAGETVPDSTSRMMAGLSALQNVQPNGFVQGAYDQLINNLVARGYAIDDELFLFSYDWRLSNRTSGRLLRAFIDASIATHNVEHPAAQVDKALVLCHSMGGVVTRSAIRYDSALSVIEGVAYMASPHYGAAKAYFVLHPKIPFSATGSKLYDFILDTVLGQVTAQPNFVETFRTKVRAMQSLWELLPDAYSLQQPILGRWVLYKRGSTNSGIIYTAVETYDQNHKWQFPEAAQRASVADAMAFKADIGYADPDPANSLVIYSKDQPTDNAVTWRGGAIKRFENIRAEPAPPNGDGTVTVESARDFQGSQASVVVPGNHSQVPNSNEAFNAIVQKYGL